MAHLSNVHGETRADDDLPDTTRPAAPTGESPGGRNRARTSLMRGDASVYRLSPVGLECAVAGDCLEVGVGVQDRDVRSDGDGRDETVDQLPNGLTAMPTAAIDSGGLLVVDWLGWQQRGPGEQSTQAVEVTLVAGPRQDLHANRVAARDVSTEECIDTGADRAGRVA